MDKPYLLLYNSFNNITLLEEFFMQLPKDIRYIGVNDHQIDLFEGQYIVPNGMAYNSYLILDEQVAVFDTVDARFGSEWLGNLALALNGRKPDYLIVQHMEPDHSANIAAFLQAYPAAKVVCNAKTLNIIHQFFGELPGMETVIVKEGDVLSLGSHELHFVFAPMVHWPEVMITYDAPTKTLFSADAFGKFGALDVEEEWDDEARRYYIGIVGKYGQQVQNVLKKAAALEIETICPLHGPVLSGDLSHYLELYSIWSAYAVETPGVMIAYTSVYGNTRRAAELLAEELKKRDCPAVVLMDLARCDMAEAVANAFRYGKLVLATTTYNADIYPFMRTFVEHLTERGYRNRTLGVIENGSWAPQAAKVIHAAFEDSKNITWLENDIRIKSAMTEENKAELCDMAEELCREYMERDTDIATKNDLKALHRIGYGLYIVTTKDGEKHNGLVVNTVSQIASEPKLISVSISKANYTHELIQKSGLLNINVLSVDAPFQLIEHYGFHSGRDTDKFADVDYTTTDNGLAILPQYINACLSLKVEQYMDLGSHGMFICSVTESRVLSEMATMTYEYYQNYVKPNPDAGKKGYVCTVCGYVYEGDKLPEDFVCPLCKHGAADFEAIG